MPAVHYPPSEGKVAVLSSNRGFTAGLDVPGGRKVQGEGGGGAEEGGGGVGTEEGDDAGCKGGGGSEEGEEGVGAQEGL